MSMTITLLPEEEKKLVQRAAALGRDVAGHVRDLIKRDIEHASFAELLKPLHDSVADSGIKTHELDSLLQSAIDNSRANRK